MADVTPTGVAGLGLSGYRSLSEARLQDTLGADIDVSPETPLGGLVSVIAPALTEIDEQLVSMSNGTSVLHAGGRQLDDLGSLLQVPRRGAARSAVTLTVTGTAGTAIPAQSRVRTAGGVQFETAVPATIGAGGTAEVLAQAVDDGPVEAGPDTLTTIETNVSGWTAVTNTLAAVVGRAVEADTDYRARLLLSTARISQGPAAAITSALTEAGATHVRIEANDTTASVTRQGAAIPAHSVMAIAYGGTDADIAAALLRSKGLGVGMAGATTVSGATFERAATVAVKVTVVTVVGATFPADGAAQIRDALVDYVAGTWRAAVGQFDTTGQEIGEGMDTNRLLTPIQSVPGHRVTSVTVTDTAATALPAVTPLARLYTLAPANVVLTITT